MTFILPLVSFSKHVMSIESKRSSMLGQGLWWWSLALMGKRYLKHTPSIGLWYPKGAIFELIGYLANQEKKAQAQQ